MDLETQVVGYALEYGEVRIIRDDDALYVLIVVFSVKRFRSFTWR